jgi:hypothetical protein
LTKICLIVIFGVAAIWIGPVGIVRLFPLKGEKRKLLSGVSFVTIGVMGIAFLGVLLAFG